MNIQNNFYLECFISILMRGRVSNFPLVSPFFETRNKSLKVQRRDCWVEHKRRLIIFLDSNKNASYNLSSACLGSISFLLAAEGKYDETGPRLCFIQIEKFLSSLSDLSIIIFSSSK